MALQNIRDTASKLKKLKQMLKPSELKDLAIEKVSQKKAEFQRKKAELQLKFKNRMELLEAYTETTPFLQLRDKLSFMIGVIIFGVFSYIMGRWPNDFFYTFYCTFVPLLILIRFYNYFKVKWHYFLTDFCYVGGTVVLLFLALFPKSDLLYRSAFLFSTGALGVATAAFRNSLKFHKFDDIISLCTHPVPLICMWNVKQVTMAS